MNQVGAARRTRVVVNGRFLTRAPTGVDRVARRILHELDRGLAADPFAEVIVAAPRDGPLAQLDLVNIALIRVGRRHGVLWEQIDLPAAFKRDVILNLCNTAPAVHARNVVLMHDALVYDEPGSYGRSFRLWYKALLPLIARRALQVVTVSRYSAQRLRQHGVVADRDVNVIANGSDHLLDVSVAEAPAFGRFVLFVGSPVAHKNLGLFCAMAEAFSGRLAFVVVGAVDSAVYEPARAEPTPNNLYMLGRVCDAQLKTLYQRAICLAFPSRAEGFGLPPLEAMSLGCPVISAPCAAMPDVLGDAALYADPLVLQEWIDAIERVISDAPLRASLGHAGRARAARYTWGAAGEAYIRILRTTVLASEKCLCDPAHAPVRS